MRATRALVLLLLTLGGCTADNPGGGSDGSVYAGDMAGCGQLGAACCANRICASGNCVGNGAGTCLACGGAGQACCAGRACGAGEVCTGNGGAGICAVCGNPGEACCAADGCNGGGCCVAAICVASGGTCPTVGGACMNGSCGTCGALGQPCCQDPMMGGRAICTGPSVTCVQNTCAACGGPGQPCCANNSCTGASLVCGDGNVCTACGGPGQACCAGDLCATGCCDGNRGLCIADGAACGNGGMCSGGMCTMPMAGCGMGQPFPTFVAACTNNDSCIFGMHEINCCGSQLAIGMNHDQLNAFNAAEAAWDKTCGACNCPMALPTAQDGKMCMMQNITVSCDNGNCTTKCN